MPSCPQYGNLPGCRLRLSSVVSTAPISNHAAIRLRPHSLRSCHLLFGRLTDQPPHRSHSISHRACHPYQFLQLEINPPRNLGFRYPELSDCSCHLLSLQLEIKSPRQLGIHFPRLVPSQSDWKSDHRVALLASINSPPPDPELPIFFHPPPFHNLSTPQPLNSTTSHNLPRSPLASRLVDLEPSSQG